MVALPSCHVQLVGPKPLPRAYPRELRTLGDHLRKRRIDLGLLQRDVASRLKVNEATVCNWETNRTSAQLRVMARIIAFLGYCPYHPQSDLLGQRIRAQRRCHGTTSDRDAVLGAQRLG
jgi:DNA-binding XRE family transcriptional regulator